MATLIQNLNLANTFGEWVSITNETVTAYNTIYASDFTKPTGTLYLSGTGTSLAVSNGSVFTGLVDISGAGSLLVRHSAEVQNTLYLTNKDGGSIHSLVFSANGVANVNYINITGAGRSANVANNAWIGGTLTVVGNTALGANCTVVDDITANNETLTYHLNVGRDVGVGRFLTVASLTRLNGDVFVNASAIIQSTATVNNLISNTNITTVTINTNRSYANNVFANNITYANVLYTSNTIFSNTNIVANAGIVYANVVSANNIRFTNDLLSATGTVQAGNGIFATLFVNGNFNILGQTVYSANAFVLSDGAPFPGTPQVTNQFGVLRVSRATANAEVRWNNNSKWWEYRNVDDNVDATSYQRILSANDYVSINTSISLANTNLKSYVDTAVTSLQSQISANAVSANAVISTANTDLKNYVDVADASLRSQISSNVSSLQTQISANAVSSNAMIVQANTAMKTYVDGNFLRVASGGTTQTIASDVTITGNFVVNGTTSYINTQTITTQDSLIRLANNNTSSDSLDIGFIAPYQTGGFTRFTGLFRKAGSGTYYLAQAIVNDPTANVVQSFGTNFRATLDANFTGGQISGLSNPLGINDGGTGATSASAALTTLLTAAAGTGTSGQVLTTSGAGSYYWSTAGSGGGSTQGTTINSSRLTYIVGTNATAGETRFTAPTYVVGASQTRVYINGVRQFLSDYTEANTTAIVLSPGTGLVAGDTMVIEVDGYNTYTQLASATSFSPTGDISATTVQNAIAELDSEKAPKASPTLTGTPLAPTAALSVSPSSTQIATVGFVTALANSNYTFSHNISGNAGSVTNGVYTSSSYTNPTWLTISQITSLGVGTAASGTTGEIRATNNITAYYSSDKKFKENIADIPNALSIVNSIGGKYFDWTDDYLKSHGGPDGYFLRKSDFGVIAQDVQESFPVAVRERDDGSLAVDYEKLSALAFAAIKELSAEVERLKKIIEGK